MVLQVLKDPAPAAWLTRSGIAWDVLATFGPHTLYPAHARLRYIPDDGDAPRPEIPPRPLGEQGDGPVMAELCDMLAADTTTPQLCYFCLWDGWPEIDETITTGPPVVAIPNRLYHLFSGPLSDVGQWCAQPTPDTPPAAFIWPAGRPCLVCGIGRRPDVGRHQRIRGHDLATRRPDPTRHRRGRSATISLI